MAGKQKQDNESGGFVNDSGIGAGASFPPQAKGLNWGAFFLSWIWGIGNNTYIALLCLVPPITFIMPFVLLFKGNEWAWKNKEWKTVAQFHKTQSTWAGVGACTTIPALIGIAILGYMFNTTIASGPPAP